jgi:dUTP pyrophosphatase
MFISKFIMSTTSHYLLKLKLPADLPSQIHNMYIEAVALHNESINTQCYFDAGFNLICPADIKVAGLSTVKVDLGVCGAMSYICGSAPKTNSTGTPVGYFLYPRSSTGTKTPLRLANSVGVIDSGYRGNYIAAFDNVRSESFQIEQTQRLVQICSPNLTYPLRVKLVEELDMDTVRGEGGFGSTGR